MLNRSIYWLIVISVTLYTFGQGKWHERLAAMICLFGSILTNMVSRSGTTIYYTSVESGVFAVDMLALAGFVALALRSKRFWPLWVAGFQLTSVSSHLIKAFHSSLVPQVYAAAERFWIYPILLVIIVATWRSRRTWSGPGGLTASPA